MVRCRALWAVTFEQATGPSLARDLSEIALDDVMTAAQVGEMLLVPRSTIEEYGRRGVLPSIKLGRHRRFLRGDVEAALAAMRGAARPPSGGRGL